MREKYAREDAEADLLNYLTAMRLMRENMRRPPDSRYSCFEDFVLCHGQPMILSPDPAPFKLGRIKECFSNAARRVIVDDRLTYCEGYAASIIPVHHAWVLDEKGYVVETTWREPGHAYYGVPFRRRFLMDTLARKGTYGVLDWMDSMPVLTMDESGFLAAPFIVKG